jgi:ribonuclease VapC
MSIKASALKALLTDEDDARELLARLQAKERTISPLALWETAIATARVLVLTTSEARQSP